MHVSCQKGWQAHLQSGDGRRTFDFAGQNTGCSAVFTLAAIAERMLGNQSIRWTIERGCLLVGQLLSVLQPLDVIQNEHQASHKKRAGPRGDGNGIVSSEIMPENGLYCGTPIDRLTSKR